MHKVIDAEALQLLLAYDWPGNIRELQHAIEGAILLSHDNVITARDFLLHSSSLQTSGSLQYSTVAQSTSLTLEGVERIHIEDALKKNNFNRVKTATALGITPKTLYLKIKKYRIAIPA